MDDSGDGWQTVMPTTHSSIQRLSRDAWAELEACERQILKEWEQTHTHWSGIGKHTPLDDHTEAKRLHTRFKLANDTPLGTGSFGVVQKVIYANNGRTICLARKQVRPPHRRFPIQLLREEASVMEKLDHDHIVKLVGTYCISSNLYLLLWPVAVCNLDCLFNDIDHLKSGEGDREDIIKRLYTLDLHNLSAVDKRCQPNAGTCPLKYLQQAMGCVSRAVAYCHQEKIRHLDLKPSNILLNPGRVYIADFGIAKDVGERDHTMTRGPAGTPKWRAPELNQVQCDWSMQAAEVYSLGLVLLNIATVIHGGDLADFDEIIGDLTPRGRADKISAYLPKLERLALATQEVHDVNAFTFAPKHAFHLVSRMLDLDAERRPSIFQVDAELIDLGGVEQVYHSNCCKKSTRFVTDRINTKIRALVDERDRLKADHMGMLRRLEVLEAKDDTYESRIRKERNTHAENITRLQEILEKERNERKRLEAQLAEFQQTYRRQPRPSIPRPASDPAQGGLMMRMRPRTHPIPNDPAALLSPPIKMQTKVAAPSVVPGSRLTYSQTAACAVAAKPESPHLAAAAIPKAMSPHLLPRRDSLNPTLIPRRDSMNRLANSPSPGAATPGSPNPDLAGYTLRSRNSGSRLPQPVNPATPIRAGTPALNRDLSSTDSTTYSMNSSVFSRLEGSKHSLAETSFAGTPAIGTPALNQERKNSHTAESYEHVEHGNSEADQAVEMGYGLGITVTERRESVSTRRNSILDNASVTSSSIPATASIGSPHPSGSALSSPRAAHAQIDGHRLTRFKIPSMPTAKSWADVARKERR
ncbi:kinase-like domain-containing protein [Triangularia setosa]|uniref:Kinase-like domain-containing protein n=1 Tax=Triangularia setosa TaxID=2587417 RepID=A0AAN7A5Q3_9PEZI|nr:kinase-like domain-containing protein [Podospora setosa]